MNNKLVLLIAVIFLVAALFLRLYKINNQLYFTYDQGEDALEVQKIILGKPVLIGPQTGIPGFFVGPFYYYLIAPFYWLGKGNPLFPIIFLISLDVFGIIIASLLVKKKVGWIGFLISFLLLATNSSHIKHSRWLSNPNPIFFLAPLYFYYLLIFLNNKTNPQKNKKTALFLGLILGLVVQTELANAIFFIPATLIVLIVRKMRVNKHYLKYFSFSFLLTFFPLILFNFNNKFLMVTALRNYLLNPASRLLLLEVFQKRIPFYQKTLTNFITPKNQLLFTVSLGIIIIFLITKKFWQDNLLLILTSWFFTPLIFMMFYTANKGVIWDYYLISQPIPFLLILATAVTLLIKKYKLAGQIIAIFFLCLIVKTNLAEWQFARLEKCNLVSYGKMREAINYIYSEAQGKPFNVDVFVPNLAPIAYDYLFLWYGQKKYGYLPSKENQREKLLFFIMEPGQKYNEGEQYWRNWWYNQRRSRGKIITKMNFGEIDIEKREILSL